MSDENLIKIVIAVLAREHYACFEEILAKCIAFDMLYFDKHYKHLITMDKQSFAENLKQKLSEVLYDDNDVVPDNSPSLWTLFLRKTEDNLYDLAPIDCDGYPQMSSENNEKFARLEEYIEEIVLLADENHDYWTNVYKNN